MALDVGPTVKAHRLAEDFTVIFHLNGMNIISPRKDCQAFQVGLGMLLREYFLSVHWACNSSSALQTTTNTSQKVNFYEPWQKTLGVVLASTKVGPTFKWCSHISATPIMSTCLWTDSVSRQIPLWWPWCLCVYSASQGKTEDLFPKGPSKTPWEGSPCLAIGDTTMVIVLWRAETAHMDMLS